MTTMIPFRIGEEIMLKEVHDYDGIEPGTKTVITNERHWTDPHKWLVVNINGHRYGVNKFDERWERTSWKSRYSPD